VDAFIINLDRATDRWSFIQTGFAMTDINPHRIPAIDGDILDSRDKDYSASLYRWFHGREINLLEVGCYLSHVKAMRAFLATDEPFAMICEDDIVIEPGLEEVLQGAFRYSKYWNILRLTGLTKGRPLKVAKSDNKHVLCLSLGRLKGAGAYLVDRTAAQVLVERLLPMRLPFDHAVDREWFYGLNSAYILPFPISQTRKRFSSQIQTKSKPKFSFLRRLLSTYPYQTVNEATRWIFRLIHFAQMKIEVAELRAWSASTGKGSPLPRTYSMNFAPKRSRTVGSE
jgi:glycosyl transferase family 25